MAHGFLGTIGWIKGNLMSSSQASEKGYSNENFYPGAPNIPDSEPLFPPPEFKYTLVGDVSVNSKWEATGFDLTYGSPSKSYIKLANSSFRNNYEFQIAFTLFSLPSKSRRFCIAASPVSAGQQDGFIGYIHNSAGTSYKIGTSNRGASASSLTLSDIPLNKKLYLIVRGVQGQDIKAYFKEEGGKEQLINSAGNSNSTLNLTNFGIGGDPGSYIASSSQGLDGKIHLSECHFKQL